MSISNIKQAFLADTARVLGEVSLGKNANIWYGASIRGDVAAISIGEGTNVQDNAVIHCDSGVPNVIGANVTIGHTAIVHGESVGDWTLIGMGAKVLGRTKIGQHCLIGAGALLPPGMVVPDGMVAIGVPAKVVRETTDEEKAYLKWLAPHYVKLAAHHAENQNDVRVKPWAEQ